MNLNDTVSSLVLQSLVFRASTQAHYNTIEAGVAALEYRAKQGAVPVSMEKAVSPVPLDPFDMNPLRYRIEGEGFVVYSVDETGKFDGDVVDAKPKPGQSDFRWPMPPCGR